MKLDPPELFIELVRRSLAFRIVELLTRHNGVRQHEIKILLDNRYDQEAVKRALAFLARHGLIEKHHNGKFRIVSLNMENKFVASLTKLINTLHEKELWSAFEKTFLGTRSRMKAVIALMSGPLVKAELSKASRVQGGAPTDIMLRPLLLNGLIIEHRGRRRVEYELNQSHPLNQVLMEFLREIDVVGNRNNNHNNGNKDMYHMLAREFVDYIIEHWDDYVVNTHRRDTIKLTGPVIRSFLKRRGAKLYPGWFVDFVVDEFKKRGFCVMVKKNGQRPNITKVKVYVSRVVCNEN
jgi:hypothetical protein